MAVSAPFAVSGSGFTELHLLRGGATDWDARCSDDAAGATGFTSLGTITGSQDFARFNFTNDSTHARYFWVKDHNDSIWVPVVRPGYAAAARFITLAGWREPVLQSTSHKSIWVSSTATNAGTGLTLASPKLQWDSNANPGTNTLFQSGDVLLGKCGDTFTTRQFDWHPNGAGAINADESNLTCYGDFTLGRPKCTAASDSNIPFNLGNTDNRPRIMLQHWDVTQSITARRNYFFNNNTTGQMHCVAFQAAYSAGTGGGIDWIFEGLHLRYGSFGLICTGNNGANNEQARLTGVTLHRCWIGDSYDYGISGQFGNGGPQNPSGIELHAIDNLSITECWFPRNGFSSAADTISTNSGGTVTYGASSLIDSAAAFVIGPSITVTSGTTTSVNVAANTLPGVNTMLSGTITFTSGVNNGISKRITANTASSITWSGAIGTSINGDTFTCNLSPAGRMVDVGGLQRLISSVPDLTHLTLIEGWANGDYGAQPQNGTLYRVCWSTPSIFRHCLYGQRSCTNVTIDNCYFSEADCMMRSGGTIQNCVFAMMSIGISMEGVQRDAVSNAVLSTQAMTVQDNAFDGFREIIDRTSGGQLGYFSWDSNDGQGGGHNNGFFTYQRNLIYSDAISSEPMSGFAGGQVQLRLTNTFTAAGATIVDNYVQHTNGFMAFDRPASYTGLITFRRNVLNLFSTGHGAYAIQTRNGEDWVPGAGQSVGANNVFGANGDGHNFRYNNTDQSNASWNTKSGDSGSTYPGSPLAPTVKRRLTDYCTFRGISATRAAYEAQAEAQWVTNWNPIWQAKYVADWMRNGAINAVAAFATALVPPDVPTLVSVTNPTNTTLDIAWTATGSYNETGFDAGISLNGVSYTVISNVAGVDGVSATLASLNSNQVYYLKVRGHNAAGNGDWSNVLTGQTSVIVTPPPPNLQVPSILIVGDYMVNGGQSKGVNCLDAKVTAAGVSELRSIYPDKIMRVCPDNPSTGAPTAAALAWFPWFDGLNGTVLFTVNPAGTDSTHVQVTGSPGWSAGQWIGYTVTVGNSFVPGYSLGFSDRKVVIGNTSDTLQVGSAWASTPTANNPVFIGGNTGTAAKGAWTDYHAVAGWLTLSEIASNTLSKRGGSSWGNDGAGIGLDAGLIRELLENTYPVSPYFQLSKFFQVAPTYSAFDLATGSSKVAFAAHLAAMNTAWSALANGNALAWDLLVLDNSQRDVVDWLANPAHQASYQQKLTETIAYFRTALGNPNLKVVILNHAAEINNVSRPSATTYANSIHRNVAAADAVGLSRCVSMEGQPLCLDSTAGFAPSENKNFYQADVYWGPMARAVRQAYDLLIAGTAPPTINGAVPTYLMLGDSIFRGPITPAYLTELESPTLTGTARDGRQGIWDARSGEGVPYDVSAADANTSGTFSNTAGPECAMLPLLMNLHPSTGCYLVKRAVDSSGLASSVVAYTADAYPGTPAAGGRWSKAYAENYPAMQAQWRAFCRWANLTLGKQVDLKGILVDLGTTDQAVTGGGAVFAAQLAQFVADLRADFSTRTSGTPVPVIFRQPQLATVSALFAEAAAVRTALQKLRAADAQFFLMDADDFERNTADGLNETPDASVEDGQRLVASLTKIAI